MSKDPVYKHWDDGPTGGTYEGEQKDGRRHGQGTFFWFMLE